MRLSDDTKLAYVARMRCLLGLLTVRTRVAHCRVWARHVIVENFRAAFSVLSLGHGQASVRRFALGFRLGIVARGVGRTCFLANSLFILPGTIEGGAH